MAGEQQQPSLQQSVERLSAKMLVFSERFQRICSQRDDALRRISDLEQQLQGLQKRVDDLARENEFLKIATTLAPTRQDVEHTRELLSSLVREIDKCIADLKE